MAEARSPALLQRLITLHGPGKTYNTPGLDIAWAIIPNAELRRRFQASMQKLVPDTCCLGFTALRAAFQSAEPWRQALLAQLRINRDIVSAALDRMGLPHTHPEVSFLTWIDARALAAKVGSAAAWLERHGVGLSDGAGFGRPGYLRLNFATPPSFVGRGLGKDGSGRRGRLRKKERLLIGRPSLRHGGPLRRLKWVRRWCTSPA